MGDRSDSLAQAGREKAHSDAHGQRQGRRSRHISAARLALQNFTSQWFLVPQGTGAVALVLHQLGFQFRGLAIISQCFWVLTIVMLSSMLLTYSTRAVLNPAHVTKLLRTSIMETACLASISIAFSTIIQMTALNLVDTWGQAWGIVAYVLWWINLAMAVSCLAIIYIFVGMEAEGIDLVPVAIRLPPIALLTVAAAGGVVCRYGQLPPHLQVPVTIVAFLCLGAGLMLALMCDAAFLVAVFDRSWPKEQKIFSVMIACGPYGQGSFAMQILGNVVQRGAFSDGVEMSKFISPGDERIVSVCTTLLALLLWGYGTFWWVFACIAIVHEFTSQTRALLRWDQSLAAWSLVFPWVCPGFLLALLSESLCRVCKVLIEIGCIRECGDRIRHHLAVARL